ncbi:DUF1543 domain-containing protein [Psychrosphaera haliotis]|nr:DUF1543 domain-containing protein [Psychrosphaera haliotis]
MKLFMVYLGGSAGQSNIEVHDVRFVVGNTIDDTIPQLIAEWYGNRKNLHIDCYMEVNHIEGYKIDIADTKCSSGLKLYFVNLGGYQPTKFTELHEFGLFVAASSEDAKQQAKATLLKDSVIPHKDNLMEVDECFPVSLLDGQHFVHLTESPGGQIIKPDWFGYRVIT